MYELRGNNLNHLIFNSGKTQGSLYLKRFMKAWKENKNDEGFVEKTEVVELKNRHADMPRSNQIWGIYVHVGVRRVWTGERKEGRLPQISKSVKEATSSSLYLKNISIPT